MSILPEHIRSLFGAVVVNKDKETARVKVEGGNAAFDEGKIFRSFYQVSLASGVTRVFKFVVSGDVVLLSSNIDIDDGGIEYKVYSGGVESGAFTPLPSFRTNNMSNVGTPTSNVQVFTGGALDTTAATLNDLVRIRAANANSKQATVGALDDDMRGFPATTAYVVIENLDGVSGTSSGVIKWQWQNR